MNGIELERGEMYVTSQCYPNREGFIVSVTSHEDDTFGLHVKIRTETGCYYNIEFPLKRLRRFKGII